MFKSKSVHLFISCLILTFILHGCGINSENDTETSHFFELSELRESVATGINFQLKQPGAYYDGMIFVGTTEGIWAYNLKEDRWETPLLDDYRIRSLYQHPQRPEIMFAGTRLPDYQHSETVYRSVDGGRNWEPSLEIPIDPNSNSFKDFTYFSSRPGHPDQVYALVISTLGWQIAVSEDAGVSWSMTNFELGDKYHVHRIISFLPDHGSKLFVGSKDYSVEESYLGYFEIDEEDAAHLTNYQVVVSKQDLRDKTITYSFSGSVLQDRIYFGHRGALSAISLPIGSSQFIFQHEESEYMVPEIHAIWENPDNPEHLLFGGSIALVTGNMSLFETFDGGENIRKFDELMGMANPQVTDIIQTSNFPVVVMNDMGHQSIRLYRYAPEAE
jgi:hypothetical protein